MTQSQSLLSRRHISQHLKVMHVMNELFTCCFSKKKEAIQKICPLWAKGEQISTGNHYCPLELDFGIWYKACPVTKGLFSSMGLLRWLPRLGFGFIFSLNFAYRLFTPLIEDFKAGFFENLSNIYRKTVIEWQQILF